MARTYGPIQTGTPYTTATINLSDYGTVIHDNSSTLIYASGTNVPPTVRLFKLIKDALTAVGITSEIRIYVNSDYYTEYTYPTLSFIFDGNEYLLLVNHSGNNNGPFIDFPIRKNSSTITMRPIAPASINSYYSGAQVSDKTVSFWFGQTSSEYWFNQVFADVTTYGSYVVNIQCVVDSDRNVLTILGKSSNNHVLFISVGKHGDANADLGELSVMDGPSISGGTGLQSRIFSDANSGYRELIAALGPQTRTPNSSSAVLAFPVYIVQQMESSAFVGAVSSIAVYTDLMLATSNEPNITEGTRFADGTWLCACTHTSSTVQSAILIPWGGNSVPSVFD